MKNVRKLIATTLLIASAMSVGTVKANAETSLIQDSTGWWYKMDSTWAVGWKQIDGKWYYFDSTGYMKYSCYIDGYYLGADGAWVEEIKSLPADALSNTSSASQSSKQATMQQIQADMPQRNSSNPELSKYQFGDENGTVGSKNAQSSTNTSYQNSSNVSSSNSNANGYSQEELERQVEEAMRNYEQRRAQHDSQLGPNGDTSGMKLETEADPEADARMSSWNK